MYVLTEEMAAKSGLPGYAEAMAACWGTAAAALEAQALVTLWRIEIASEPGGKEDAIMVQRNCALFADKKHMRDHARNAHIDAAEAHQSAVSAWRAAVDDLEAAWQEWPGGARHALVGKDKFHTPWKSACRTAWSNAQALFDKQGKIMEPFCTLCHQAHEARFTVSPVEIVGNSVIAVEDVQ